ncbi:methylated-DNA--[protein]-cysteine S-methyltransferase [Acidobacteriota bacterium]
MPKTKEEISVSSFESLIGKLHVATTSKGIAAVALPGTGKRGFQDWLKKQHPSAQITENAAINKKAIAAIKAELAGKKYPSKVILDLKGTPFQLKVWKALQKIPRGKTLTYGEVAKKIGRPKAARAVGAACRTNPIPLLVPCHRVIGSDGSLKGFASSGIGLKKKLIDREAG